MALDITKRLRRLDPARSREVRLRAVPARASGARTRRSARSRKIRPGGEAWPSRTGARGGRGRDHEGDPRVHPEQARARDLHGRGGRVAGRGCACAPTPRSARIDDKLLERLLGRSHDWNIHTDYLIRTRAPACPRALLILAKKVVRPVRPAVHGPPAQPPGADQPVPRPPAARQHPRDGARLQLELQALRHAPRSWRDACDAASRRRRRRDRL